MVIPTAHQKFALSAFGEIEQRPLQAPCLTYLGDRLVA